MLTMLPLPCACITRSSCFMLSSVPSTLVSKVAAYVSAVCCVTGPGWPSVPALLTAASRRPKRATVRLTKFRTSSSWRMSARRNSTSVPRARSSVASSWPACSWRPATTMRWPSRAKARAAARPIPVSAPVIKTTGVPITVLLSIQPLTCLPMLKARLPQAARHQQRLPGHVLRVGRRQIHRRRGDVVGLAHAAERRLRLDHLLEGASGQTGGIHPLGLDHAGVDRVHANLPRAELLGQDARDGIDGALRRGVDHGVRWAEGADTRADVDDAPPLGPHVLHRFLRDQQQAEH